MNEKKTTGFQFDPESREPRYRQLARNLKERAAGQPAGSRLPSDSELVAATGLSLFTVRQAVAELVDAGLAERIHGKGTFIRANSPAGPGTTALFLDEIQVERRYSAFYTVLFHHLIRELEARSLPVRKYFLDEPQRLIDQAFSYRGETLARAVCIFPEIVPEYRLLSRLLAMPVIFVDHEVEAEQTTCVVSPNRSGGRMAAELLTARGCRRPLFCGDALGRDNYRRRGEGFADLLPGAPHLVDQDEICRNIAAGKVDGVFCCSDSHALELLETMGKYGLVTPRDVKLVAYDGTAMLDAARTGISAIRVDLKNMAEKVCEAIVAPEPGGIYECRADVIEAESTGA